MTLDARSIRNLLAAAPLGALVACGGGDAPRIDVPAALGPRVVFVVAIDPAQPERQSLFVVDAGAAAPMGTLLDRLDLDQRVWSTTVSPDGRYLGAIVDDSASSSCPAWALFVDATDGRSWRFSDRRDCVHGLAWAPGGAALAIRYTPRSASGADLVVGLVPQFRDQVFRVNDDPALAGSVANHAFSADGERLAWVGDGGLYAVSIEPGTVSATELRSTDLPIEIALDADGSHAVYEAPGTERLRLTSTVPGSPSSETFLTAALAPGDSIDGFVMSPTGGHVLYAATIGGVPQLWLVALNAPLGEQRVDAAAPRVDLDSPGNFAFNTDGTRIAWIGDDGSPVFRVFTATVAAPTVATALTPTTENVAHQRLEWTGADALVYLTHEAINVGDVLRSVDATAPLTTVALSSTTHPVPGVDRLAVCGDGTVVFRVVDSAGVAIPEAPPNSSALYAAQALDAGSRRLLAGTITAPAFGIGAFSCQ